jgi:pimeloyl-ACP methyl ester carboxylesterase
VVLPSDDVGAGPAVVLLHAGIADRTMWAQQTAPLAAAGYRVIAVDLPGYGEAPPAVVDEPWSDVLQTLEALDVQRFAVIGNSFGGAVALRIAVSAPARVTGLLLVSAPPIDLEPSDRLQAVWDAEESALERGDVDAAVENILDAWTLAGDDAVRGRVAAMQRTAYEAMLAAAEPREAADPVEEDRPAVGRLGITSVVTAGELDMPDFLTGAAELARELGAGDPTIIPGAGHLAPLEQPERFTRLALDFLAGIPPAPAG